MMFAQESGRLKVFVINRIWGNSKGSYNRSRVLLSAFVPL